MTVERNPSATLDQIREGGAALVVTVRTRLVEATANLDDGGFMEAMMRLQEAQAALSRLANAESTLAIHAKSTIVRAQDVQQGMYIGAGRIASVEVDEHKCGHSENHVTVRLVWETGEEEEFEGSDEMIVHDEE